MFEYRNGSILTPFNYVYGLRVGHRHRAAPYRPGWKVVLGSRSWNYANEPLNIGGRTTVPFMLFWGLLCYLIVRFILPLVLWLVHLIDDTWHMRLATILLACISSTPWSRCPRSSCTGSAPTAWCSTTGSRSISGGFR